MVSWRILKVTLPPHTSPPPPLENTFIIYRSVAVI